MKIEGNYIPTWQDILRKKREDKGMTQKELADLLGITPMGLSHFELGRREAKIAFVEKWANALGTEIKLTIL